MEKPEIDDPDYDPEAEVLDGNWKLVDLPDQEARSGEEETDEVYAVRAKLYRWRDNQWKERGIGQAKVLRDKHAGRHIFMLRQESTLKIMAFSYITGEKLCQLAKLETADKSVFWRCIDTSEGAPKIEKLCLRVKTQEELDGFTKAFEQAYTENAKLQWGGKSSEETDKPKSEEPKAEQPKKDESKTEQPKSEEPKTEQPKKEETKTEQLKQDNNKPAEHNTAKQNDAKDAESDKKDGAKTD